MWSKKQFSSFDWFSPLISTECSVSPNDNISVNHKVVTLKPSLSPIPPQIILLKALPTLAADPIPARNKSSVIKPCPND